MNKNFIVVVDGVEIEMEVLFTFDADKDDQKYGGNKYVVYFDPKNEDRGLYASRYDDETNLYEISEDAEWDMIEEVVNAFYEDFDQNDEED